MSGFLRRLSPRHADALRPAAPLRSLASGSAAARGSAPEDLADVTDSDAAAAPAAVHAVGIETPSRAAATNASARIAVTAPAHVMPTASVPPVAAPAPGRLAEPVRAVPTAPRASEFDAPNHRFAREESAIETYIEGMPRPPTSPAALPRPPDPAPRAPLPSPIDVRPPVHAPPPLAASTVARLEAAATTSTPPAIHLHIDRIEVRAAARPAAPAPARPRAVPEPQSLHDYLQGKRPG